MKCNKIVIIHIYMWGAQSAQDERSYIFASHVPIIY